MTRTVRRAFTLIELLVVITIIVVLLALLSPALDQAIYQAELTVCAARLGVGASGVLAYAFDQRRHYPYRPVARALDFTGWVWVVRQEARGKVYDDRPYLRDYLSLNRALNDPMLPVIELEDPDPSAWLWPPTNRWYGLRYEVKSLNSNPNQPKERGMLRLGDRVEYSAFGALHAQRYSVLWSDKLWVNDEGRSVRSAHPDSDHKTHSITADAGSALVAGASADDPDATLSQSHYHGTELPPGSFDLNFAYDDGSVRRVDRVQTSAMSVSTTCPRPATAPACRRSAPTSRRSKASGQGSKKGMTAASTILGQAI